MTRRIHDVDLVFAVPDRRVLGENRDALLALEIHGVHDPIGEFSPFAKGPGLAQQGIDKGGLAMVDVGDHRHVPKVVATDHVDDDIDPREPALRAVAQVTPTRLLG